MLKHLIAFGLKLGYVSLVALTVLSIADIPITWILLIALAVTIPAYIADVIAFPQFGNFIATLADFVMYTFVLAILLVSFVDGSIRSLLLAAGIGGTLVFFEAIYHEFIMKKVVKVKGANPLFGKFEMQTEFAEEMDIKEAVKKDSEEKKPH
ncbi:DUF2512 family protein [Evansella clarkii]|jgi:hypothetical protein|uniref:DUF2512 family protein n=1 Tax=Evansella clarkii TaxID=79879 RepID=UPI0009974D68|nr:DUF2512 family protein [Evansella clarkii]